MNRTLRRSAVTLVLTFVAGSVFGQSRLYTNVDLVTGRVKWERPLPSADELRWLLAHSFVLPRPWSPLDPISVSGGARTTDGPYGTLMLTPAKPLAEPWSVTTHYGRHGVQTYFNGRPFPGQGPSIPDRAPPGLHTVRRNQETEKSEHRVRR
jgi:hypothetical protein